MLRVVMGLMLLLGMGCSSFDSNYEPSWGDDDSASGDDDDQVGDDDDAVGDDDQTDDDDATGDPIIRVDPDQIRLKIEVLSSDTADLTIFNDGDAPLHIISVTQVVGTNGIGVSTFGGDIVVGGHYTLSPAVTAECHTEGELFDTVQIASDDMDNNPLDVDIIVDCRPAA